MQKADIAKRLVAFVIDSMVINTISSVIIMPFMFLIFIPLIALDERSARANTALTPLAIMLICCVVVLAIVASLAITYAYYIYVPVKYWQGATAGKRVMKLRVVKTNGEEVGQMDMFLREIIGKFVSGLVFYLGYIWILFDDKGQGWHDKIADTWVVEEKE